MSGINVKNTCVAIRWKYSNFLTNLSLEYRSSRTFAGEDQWSSLPSRLHGPEALPTSS